MNQTLGPSHGPSRESQAMHRLPVEHRIVLHVPGFELIPAKAHRDRFAVTLQRTARLWSLGATCTPLHAAMPGAPVAVFSARAAGPDWLTETEVRLLTWDDLIRRELARPALQRFARGIAALADMVGSGTLGRYVAADWRHGCFALGPVAALLGLLTAALAIGGWVGGVPGALLGLLLLPALAAVADRVTVLGLLLANRRVILDIARGRHPAQAARVHLFATEIIRAMRPHGTGEVVLSGHGLGAAFAVQALAEALRRMPDLLTRRGAPRFALLGLGSQVLAVALHPAARRMRRDVADLALTPGLVWVEHALRHDALSFGRADPVAVLGLPGRGPRIEVAEARDMVDRATWQRIQWRPLRLHWQYVMGNGRPHALDHGLMACGPLPAGGGMRADRVLGRDGGIISASVPAAENAGVPAAENASVPAAQGAIVPAALATAAS